MMYTVYKITNAIDDRYYIGVHKTSKVDDSYCGSGKIIRLFVKKYGKDVISKEILHVFDDINSAFKKEIELLVPGLSDCNCMNIAQGGQGGPFFLGKHHSEETRKRLSTSHLGVPLSESHRKSLKAINCRYWKGKKMSEETKQKISSTKKSQPSCVLGKHWKLSEETKGKMSLARKGKMPKYIPNNTGRSHSVETKRKISESQRKRRYELKKRITETLARIGTESGS